MAHLFFVLKAFSPAKVFRFAEAVAYFIGALAFFKKGNEIFTGGFYDTADGSIHIDLNAGNKGEGVMLFTAGHESGHDIKKYNPEGFRRLSEFLAKEYGKKGVSVHAHVLAMQKKSKQNLTYDEAHEEWVCQSLQRMFASVINNKDSGVLQRLQQYDNKVAQLLYKALTKLASKINALLEKLTPGTFEEQFVAEMDATVRKLFEAMYAEELVTAIDNAQWLSGVDVMSDIEAIDGMTSYLKLQEKDEFTDIQNDVLYPTSARERSAFNRSMANKTYKLKNKEIADIIIYTADNAYFISANGYMSGNILFKEKIDGNEDLINTLRKEFQNGTLTTSEGINLFIQGIRNDGGRGYRRHASLKEILAAEGYDDLDTEPHISNSTRSNSGSNQTSKKQRRESLTPRQKKYQARDSEGNELSGDDVKTQTADDSTKYILSESFTDNLLNSFGIEKRKLGDYVHVQNHVFDTLMKEGFFTDKILRNRTDVNKGSGMVVEINKSSIDETFSFNNFVRLGKFKKIAKLATIRELPNVIKHGHMVADDVANKYANSENKKFAYIEYATEVDGKEIMVRIAIKKTPQKNKFWVHSIYTIENVSDSPASTNHGTEAGHITADTGRIVTQESDSVKMYSGNDDLRFQERSPQDEFAEEAHEITSLNGSSYIDSYTEEQYNNFGWVRANNILSAKENAILRSKFAEALSHQSNPPKSKSGEYMISVGEPLENKIVYMKGTIDSPVITLVLKIDLDNETELAYERRQVYVYGHRGIHPKTASIFRRYNPSDVGYNLWAQQRKNSEGNRNYSRSGIDGTGNRSKTKRITRFRVNEDGSYTETYADGTEKTFSNENLEASDIRYQERSTEDISNRGLLANALESAATPGEEKNRLRNYKTKDRVLTDTERAIILEAVNNALKNPLQMTQSQY